MFPGEIGILQFLEGIRTPFLNRFFEAVTMLGEEMILIVLMAVIYYVFDKRLAQKMFFVTAVSLGVNCVIKAIVKLPRPFSTGKVSCVREQTATGYSFPSGHTQNFATWTTAFAFHLKKYFLMICAFVLTVLLAFSRVYLGAHYPSDVIAGALLGIAAALGLSLLYERVTNKEMLYVAVLIVMAPFAVCFMIKPDPLFEDFYKFYGMFAGFLCAVIFEKKFVSLDYKTAMWRRLLRVIIGVLLALVIKKVLESVLTSGDVRISFAFDMLRYFVLVFVMLGPCAMLFKKMKI